MISASKFCEQALTGNYIGIPYEKLDCQAFVEQVLKDCGEKRDWRGSNHMWREALSEKHKITNEMDIPAGAWLFTIKQDGGEKERGYNDSEGNATHVGIYLGLSRVIHSTTGGVQWDDISRPRWTHYGLAKCIDYTQDYISDKANAEYYADRLRYNLGKDVSNVEQNKTSSPVKNTPKIIKYIDVSDMTDEQICSLLSRGLL